MNPIAKIVVDGYTYWKITPLDEIPHTYDSLVFHSGIWSMYVALYAVALWIALELIFQVHVTFRRWGGLYYWTVLMTSIGVGLHVSAFIPKTFWLLTIATEIGTTVIVKTADVLEQTGFCLVLYSRLNLVMRAQNQRYLKWILTLILVSSFLVHTPTIIFTIGYNTRHSFWFRHALVAEGFIVLWFTILELCLSTTYTYYTARLVKESSVLVAHSVEREQSKKTRRNLLLFMIFAQIITFTFDLTMCVLIGLRTRYKPPFIPFFYGVKLKVEFMALNQLQNLVQPNVNMFHFTGDSGPANQPHRYARNNRDVEVGLEPNHTPVIVHQDSCESPGDAPTIVPISPASKKDSDLRLTPGHDAAQSSCNMVQRPMIQVSQVSSTGSVSELERLYLGRASK
jgi:hypothetical protein